MLWSALRVPTVGWHRGPGRGGNVPGFGRSRTPQTHLQPLPSWRKALICGARSAPPPRLVKPLTPDAQSAAGNTGKVLG